MGTVNHATAPHSPAVRRLDITEEVCPLTFVKAKLLMEELASGDIAEIRLAGVEPLGNVPRALVEDGHEILALAAETTGPGADPHGPHILRVRKG
jgi:TusA-related sulfurtransferase